MCHWLLLSPCLSPYAVVALPVLRVALSMSVATSAVQITLFQEAQVLDMNRDDMGIITVSQAINTLGVVEAANPVALTMFGYNKRDIVGKNISLIVPPPMSGMHHTYLRKYLESGRQVVCVYNKYLGASVSSVHCSLQTPLSLALHLLYSGREEGC